AFPAVASSARIMPFAAMASCAISNRAFFGVTSRATFVRSCSGAAPTLHTRDGAAIISTLLCGLVLAGNARIPIGEAAVGVLLPRPNVQLVESRQAVPIGLVDEVRQMSVERGRSTLRMKLRPVACDDDELDADQAQRAIWQRFVDQGFGLVRVQR